LQQIYRSENAFPIIRIDRPTDCIVEFVVAYIHWSLQYVQGGKKTDTLCFVRLNFVKY